MERSDQENDKLRHRHELMSGEAARRFARKSSRGHRDQDHLRSEYRQAATFWGHEIEIFIRQAFWFLGNPASAGGQLRKPVDRTSMVESRAHLFIGHARVGLEFFPSTQAPRPPCAVPPDRATLQRRGAWLRLAGRGWKAWEEWRDEEGGRSSC